MQIINLRQLRYFVKVVSVGNITRAAEQLYVAQPALGVQIRHLERDLNTSLIVRHSRGVSPTPAGQLLFDRAVAILEEVARTEQAVRTLGAEGSASLIFGTTPSIMNMLGPDILIAARELLPKTNISVIEQLSFLLIEAIRREELDLALAFQVDEQPGFVRRPIMEERLLYVEAPGKSRSGDTIDLAEALDASLVLPGERDMVRRLVKAQADRLGLQLNVEFEVQSIPAIKNVVAQGLASSIVPYGTVYEELREGTLVGRTISEPTIVRTLYLVRPAEKSIAVPVEHLDQFMDRLIGQIQEKLGPLAVRLPD